MQKSIWFLPVCEKTFHSKKLIPIYVEKSLKKIFIKFC